MAILRTEGVTKRFAKFTALAGVSLEVKEEEIRSIIGPNGPGKTTFFNVVSGMFRPNEGRIYFDGRDITGTPSYQIVKYGMASTFQIVSIFHDLTVLENIMLPVLTKRRKNMDFFSPPHVQEDIMEKSFEVIKEIGLVKDALALAGNLSHGDKKSWT